MVIDITNKLFKNLEICKVNDSSAMMKHERVKTDLSKMRKYFMKVDVNEFSRKKFMSAKTYNFRLIGVIWSSE